MTKEFNLSDKIIKVHKSIPVKIIEKLNKNISDASLIRTEDVREAIRRLKEECWKLFDLDELYEKDAKPFLEILNKIFGDDLI